MVSSGEGRDGGTSDLCSCLGNQGSRPSEGQEGLEWPGQMKPVYTQPSSPFVVFWVSSVGPNVVESKILAGGYVCQGLNQ